VLYNIKEDSWRTAKFRQEGFGYGDRVQPTDVCCGQRGVEVGISGESLDRDLVSLWLSVPWDELNAADADGYDEVFQNSSSCKSTSGGD
jgi:hypothetical protein